MSDGFLFESLAESRKEELKDIIQKQMSLPKKNIPKTPYDKIETLQSLVRRVREIFPNLEESTVLYYVNSSNNESYDRIYDELIQNLISNSFDPNTRKR